MLTGTKVRHVASLGGHVSGVVSDAGPRRHEWVVSTLLRPHMAGMLAGDLEAALPPERNRYLGVVCLVARVRRSVSPYYALNITDRRIPLTSVVETTHVVDPAHVGGHLLYVPRYVRPESPELERPAREIKDEYLGHVRTMFPAFRPDEDVLNWQVARSRQAEPVHPAGAHDRVPDPVVVPGFMAVSSAHVYPDVVHAHAIVGVGDRAARTLVARLRAAKPEREAA